MCLANDVLKPSHHHPCGKAIPKFLKRLELVPAVLREVKAGMSTDSRIPTFVATRFRGLTGEGQSQGGNMSGRSELLHSLEQEGADRGYDINEPCR